MLKLKFNIFQKKLEEGKRNGHFPTIHCMVQIDRFTFIMQSKDKWEYYTDMLYEDIFMFAERDEIDPAHAIDMFVTTYCSNTLPIEEAEYKSIISLELPQLENITPLEDQNSQVTKTGAESINLSPKVEILSGDEIVDEAEGYSDFLLKFFNMLERKTLRAANSIEVEKSINKTFGEFLRDFFNSVNTVVFASKVKRFIKIDLLAGLTSAESELNMDVGVTEEFENKLNQLASQQIDGYIINGKKWPGIKGATKELQAQVIQVVQAGINENIGIKAIKENISDKFAVFSDWRSEMIARTETTRMINEGKIIGYKESGIEGMKAWSTAIDNRTSDICRRLNGQKRLLDEDFIDPETRRAYPCPPAHPNCRSVIVFIAK